MSLRHLSQSCVHVLSMRRHLERRGLGPQSGTTTAEYAIGTLAACGFAAVLFKIVTSSSVSALLSGLIHKALGSAG